MGNYNSSKDESTNSAPTAKIIHEDGQLKEFWYPIKVSEIVINSTNFICKADDMDYDDYITPINGEEELQLGQLYFLLPLTWLHKPLRAPTMAALAVKASLALKTKTSQEIRPIVAISDSGRSGIGHGGGRGLDVKRKGRSGAWMRKSKFGPNLSITIPWRK